MNGDGVPVECIATAANINDPVLFKRLFLVAFAVMARIKAVFADYGYDAQSSRDLCRRFGAEPHIHKQRQPSEAGLGKQRWLAERSNAWLLENKRLALRPAWLHRSGPAAGSLHTPGCRKVCTGVVTNTFASCFRTLPDRVDDGSERLAGLGQVAFPMIVIAAGLARDQSGLLQCLQVLGKQGRGDLQNATAYHEQPALLELSLQTQ